MSLKTTGAQRIPPRSSSGTIRRRIIVGNGIVGFLLLLAGLISVWQVARLATAVEDLQRVARNVAAVSEVRHQSLTVYATVNRLLPGEDAAAFGLQVGDALAELSASQAQMRVQLADVTDPVLVSAMQRVDSEVDNVLGVGATMVRQAQGEKWPNVHVRSGVLSRDQQEVVEAVEGLVSIMQTEEASAASEVSRARRAALVLPLATLAVAVGLGTVLAWKVTGSITHPVEQLAAASKRIAAGDFSEPVLVSSEDELGQLATTFNDMARQLQRHYDDLEERVAERTRALQASAEVARRLATILDRHELARAVVNQVQQAFGYYHVQIYLYDTRRESLLLIAGTGEAGQIMQLSGHRIGLGTGLVGRAAERNEVTLVPDVSLTRDWLPNPLLPETKAELAVPIAYAGGVVGVLDVQADVVSGVTSDDAELVLSIARQVAIALENARLVEEAEQRADRAALVNRISQQIQRARSVDSVLRVAAVELAEALDVHKAAIEIHAPSSRNNDRKLRSKKGGNGDGQ